MEKESNNHYLVKAGHRFDNEGTYDGARVEVTDKKTGKTFQVSHGEFMIYNAKIEAKDIRAEAQAIQGATIVRITATFEDTRNLGPDALNHYRAKVNWKDGPLTEARGGSPQDGIEIRQEGSKIIVNAVHTYTRRSDYTILVDLMEDDGGRWKEAHTYTHKSENPKGTGGMASNFLTISTRHPDAPKTKPEVPSPQPPGSAPLPSPSKPPQQVDLQVRDVRWVPLSSHRETGSVVSVYVRSQNYMGDATIRIYQSGDGKTPEALLAERTVSITPNSANGSQEVRMVIYASPDRTWLKSPNYLIAVVDPGNEIRESNETNNTGSLKVKEPGELSYELESLAPIANTREERVELWLRANAADINAQAARFNIPPEAIAGAIAWEALRFVRFSNHGIGKIHWEDSDNGWASAARQVEELNYVTHKTEQQRKAHVMKAPGAIEYIAAIMGAYADEVEKAERVYSATNRKPLVRSNIRTRPEILTTFYNGLSKPKSEFSQGAALHKDPWVVTSEKFFVRPQNAYHFAMRKLETGQGSAQNYRPGETMGSWVEENLHWLRRAVR